MNKLNKLSVFKNGRSNKRERDISLNDLREYIQKDSQLKQVTQNIRKLHACYKDAAESEQEKWKKEVSEAKVNLPIITIHGYFPEGRKDKDPHTFTELILTDIDHITQEQVDELMPRIKTLPFVVLACRSVRGEGIHILSHVEVEGGINDDNFRDVFNATTHIVECTLNVEADTSVGSISRCMFLNHDAEAYCNPEATPLNVNTALLLKKCSNKFLDKSSMMDKENNFKKYLDAADPNLNWTPGHRHHTLISLMGSVTQTGFDEEDVVKECIERYAQNDFDADEIEKTVRDCYKRYQTQAGIAKKNPRPEKDKGTKRQKAIVQEDMEDIMDEDELLDTPCPDIDALKKYIPDDFWDYAIPKNSNKHTQFASAMALLVSAGAAFRRIRCQFRRQEKATGKLYFIASGRAASGKSCIKRPHELFLHYANAIEAESEAEVTKQKEAHKTWKLCQNKCKEADCGCGAEPVMPAQVRISLSLNISASKLIHQQAHNKNIPCLLYTTEIDNNLDIKENPLSPVLREGYENETISSHTHAHGDVRVDEPNMSMIAAGTPLQVVKLLGNKENGLASRVLIMYLPESDYKGLAEEEEVVYSDFESQRKTFAERAKTFCHYVANTDLTFEIGQKNRAKIDDCIRDIEKRYSIYASDELISFTRRLPKMIINLAMIVQTIRAYDGDTQTYSLLSLDDEIVEIVVSWMPYFVEQHLRLLDSLPDTPVNTDGNAMKYAHIAKNLPCDFTKKEACEMFERYTTVSGRTVTRVLRKWVKAGLLVKTHNRYHRTDCGETHIAG